MSNSIYDYQLIITGLLMVISAIFGFYNLKIKRKGHERWRIVSDMDMTVAFTFFVTVAYMVATVMIIYTDTNFSWIKTCPWFARAFFTLLYVGIAACLNYVCNLFAMIIASELKNRILKKQAKKLNDHRKEVIREGYAYKQRVLEEYYEDLRKLERMADLDQITE